MLQPILDEFGEPMADQVGVSLTSLIIMTKSDPGLDILRAD